MFRVVPVVRQVPEDRGLLVDRPCRRVLVIRLILLGQQAPQGLLSLEVLERLGPR